MDTSFVILFRDVYRTRAGSMSRLPARSLFLLRRVIHRMTATRLALLFFKRYPMDTSFVILFRDVYRTRAGSMSRLPARSLFLLRRVIHRMTATRLALLFFKRYPMDTSFVILFPRRVSNPRGFDVSSTGSVVASASQSHPPDDRNPSRAFFLHF